jgi:hypothetical protein
MKVLTALDGVYGLKPSDKPVPEAMMCFYCPGCGFEHPYAVHTAGHPRGIVWAWNGSMEKPTFTPSLIIFQGDPSRVCHLFVTDGKIQYLGDCHHKYAGQTIDMVPIDE